MSAKKWGLHSSGTLSSSSSSISDDDSVPFNNVSRLCLSVSARRFFVISLIFSQVLENIDLRKSLSTSSSFSSFSIHCRTYRTDRFSLSIGCLSSYDRRRSRMMFAGVRGGSVDRLFTFILEFKSLLRLTKKNG